MQLNEVLKINQEITAIIHYDCDIIEFDMDGRDIFYLEYNEDTREFIEFFHEYNAFGALDMLSRYRVA